MMMPNIDIKSMFLSVAILILGVNSGLERPQTFHSSRKTVVFVHGYGDSGRSFEFFERKLRERGYECYTPTLSPADAGKGIEDLAAKLKTAITGRYGGESAISIVAFSMGGIVARYYLQRLDGAVRCQAFFTVSTPHHGTIAAYFAQGKGALQMRPKSAFLGGLNRGLDVYREMVTVSYWTPLDIMIFPAVSSIWSVADNVISCELCHPHMIVSERVINDILMRLEGDSL